MSFPFFGGWGCGGDVAGSRFGSPSVDSMATALTQTDRINHTVVLATLNLLELLWTLCNAATSADHEGDCIPTARKDIFIKLP